MHDPKQLRATVERFYDLWNDDDRAGWLEHWRAAAPGEPWIEDPVGAPVKRGWDAIGELWDRTCTDGRHFKVQLLQTLVCGNEVAAICRTEGTTAGVDFCIQSVDIHQFEGDRLRVRSYWEIPDGLPYGRWTATAGVRP